jgi:hypothetical protein
MRTLTVKRLKSEKKEVYFSSELNQLYIMIDKVLYDCDIDLKPKTSHRMSKLNLIVL